MKSSGKIYLVGIGPGEPNLLTYLSREVLGQVDFIVGYSLYVEQIQEFASSAVCETWNIGEELERADRVVQLAFEGHTVAMVSSGDIGIYGMSGPIFNILSEKGWDGISPSLEVIPGISALQSASALLGSPLMQDFCTISLSDLLTPWEDIQKRIHSASVGDFVVVFYNPKSKTRNWQLKAALTTFKDYRPGNTPVGLVKNAYRNGQDIKLTTLDNVLDNYDYIDMFTTVVVGNSSSYIYGGKFVTPRGYEKK
tara:strand:+ start:9366 stop:10124 length:759 start_codon:yes stop_codon:yes gene_type:complete